ncbi:amidohydrolase family protein [Paracerasibacillus soli]|uniref:Amidohydrolase family protein n=1 Tax=Paracerasibacillus soli TaxID=480284 RepID=A0ABU5CRD0_9BACI|nr:amidohydrolase family protein [Virgibacillus soli]MDY0408930.1 amidohydrolase family protein [Virgibacillus soli]
MKQLSSIFIRNITIHTETEVLQGGSLLLQDGKITGIYAEGEQPESYPAPLKIIEGNGLLAIPGFIDGHIHGANGADVMDATEEALDKMAEVLPKEGTTSFLATTVTQSPKILSVRYKMSPNIPISLDKLKLSVYILKDRS